MEKTMNANTELMEAIRKLGFHPFDNNDYGALVCVSAEYGDDAADYYGEFRGGYPWINPKLEELAENLQCYWEWMNPGAIALYTK